LTLIYGVRFLDGIGLSGDTRGQIQEESSSNQNEAYDNILRVYNLHPFLFGVSGDTFACAKLLSFYMSEIFSQKTENELYSLALDWPWLVDFFKTKYKQQIATNNQAPIVGLIIASVSRKSIPNLSPPSYHKPDSEKIPLKEFAKKYSKGIAEVESWIVSLELPSGETRIAEVGDILMMSSGKHVDEKVLDAFSVTSKSDNYSLTERMEAIFYTIRNPPVREIDPTFNSLIHTWVMDDKHITFKGSLTNPRPDEFQVTGQWKKAEFNDERADAKRLQSENNHRVLLETFYTLPDDKWWILDYKNHRKIALQNIIEILKEEQPEFFENNILTTKPNKLKKLKTKFERTFKISPY